MTLCASITVKLMYEKNSRLYQAGAYVVPVVGLEPTRPCEQQILSLHRLPFRHTGGYTINVTILAKGWGIVNPFTHNLL